MTEETRGAERSGPLGIVTAVGSTAVVGWIYTLSLLFSVQVAKAALCKSYDDCTYMLIEGMHSAAATQLQSFAVPKLIIC